MLNGRVRNGNGCDHPGMLTEKAVSYRPSASAVASVSFGERTRSALAVYQLAAVGVAFGSLRSLHGSGRGWGREEDQCGEAFGC